MLLLEMRPEGRRVSFTDAFQGGIEGQHEPAEGAACAGLRLRLDTDRVGLRSVATVVASACRVLATAHYARLVMRDSVLLLDSSRSLDERLQGLWIMCGARK